VRVGREELVGCEGVGWGGSSGKNVVKMGPLGIWPEATVDGWQAL
jgi:hypothetical protein